MKILTYRSWFLIVCVLSFAIFAASLYFQYVRGLQPCPLCIMQRFCALILSLIALSAILITSIIYKRRIILILVIFASLGAYFSIRQIWLQSLPADQLPACLPGLDIMLRYLPLKDILHALFWGAADCAEVTWTWLGLSMPAWSLIYFIFISLGSLACYLRFSNKAYV